MGRLIFKLFGGFDYTIIVQSVIFLVF